MTTTRPLEDKWNPDKWDVIIPDELMCSQSGFCSVETLCERLKAHPDPLLLAWLGESLLVHKPADMIIDEHGVSVDQCQAIFHTLRGGQLTSMLTALNKKLANAATNLDSKIKWGNKSYDMGDIFCWADKFQDIPFLGDLIGDSLQAMGLCNGPPAPPLTYKKTYADLPPESAKLFVAALQKLCNRISMSCEIPRERTSQEFPALIMPGNGGKTTRRIAIIHFFTSDSSDDIITNHAVETLRNQLARTGDDAEIPPRELLERFLTLPKEEAKAVVAAVEATLCERLKEQAERDAIKPAPPPRGVSRRRILKWGGGAAAAAAIAGLEYAGSTPPDVPHAPPPPTEGEVAAAQVTSGLQTAQYEVPDPQAGTEAPAENAPLPPHEPDAPATFGLRDFGIAAGGGVVGAAGVLAALKRRQFMDWVLRDENLADKDSARTR